jgi:hypothetical protein
VESMYKDVLVPHHREIDGKHRYNRLGSKKWDWNGNGIYGEADIGGPYNANWHAQFPSPAGEPHLPGHEDWSVVAENLGIPDPKTGSYVWFVHFEHALEITEEQHNAILAERDFILNRCPGDFNWDGVVNTLDVLAFLNAWIDEHPDADVNGDDEWNTLDVLTFLNLWASGC